MKHKTWFRLVLQAIGVLLIGLGAPEFIARTIGFMWYYLEMRGSIMNQEWWQWFWHSAAPLLQAAFGIYLLTGAAWLLNKIIPSNHPYCPECGYDLSRHTGVKCSECGVTLPEELARRQTQATPEQ